MQPPLELLQSLRDLHNQKDFKRFREFLAQIEQAEVVRAINAPDQPDVARGRAQMVMELRRMIEDSVQTATAMERRVNDKGPARRGGSF